MKDPLNEREFELVNIVGSRLAVNQRDLSRQMNMSLGMTNMLLRRMITKGYIRISQLNKRKVQYLLTPKGFAEKMQKSIKYTLKTIQSIGLVKKQLYNILEPLYRVGIRDFFVLGQSDLAFLIDVAIKEHFNHEARIKHIQHIEEATEEGVVLICVEKFSSPNHAHIKKVMVIEEMAKIDMNHQEGVPLG